jgi:hypothetical protein
MAGYQDTSATRSSKLKSPIDEIMFEIQALRKCAAALCMVGMAILLVCELDATHNLLRLCCFASTVCWSFVRLGSGAGACALVFATLATDYLILEPIYQINLDGETASVMASYWGLGLLLQRFGSKRPG